MADYYSKATVDKQAEIISRDREVIRQLHEKVDNLERKLERLEAPAKFYLALQKEIMDNPTVQSEWSRFLMFLKLGASEEYLQEVGAYK